MSKSCNFFVRYDHTTWFETGRIGCSARLKMALFGRFIPSWYEFTFEEQKSRSLRGPSRQNGCFKAVADHPRTD